MRKIAHLPLLITFAATSACYTYTPVQAPQPGMEVRAQLNTEAAVRRSAGLDEAIMRYEGTVVEVREGGFSLDVLVARSTSVFQDVTLRDTVSLQTSELQALMQRKISGTRTALLVLGVGVGGFALVKGIDSVVGGTGDDGNGGTPTLRLPVFGWTGSRVLLGPGHR